MSRYRIYQIDHPDPVSIGKRKRKIAIFYAIMSPIFIMIFSLFNQISKIKFVTLSEIFFPVIFGFYFFLYIKLRSDNKKIRTIGNIEFSRNGIVKRLGDSLFEYSYDTIKSLKLQKHIPAVTMLESKSGYFTFILTILFIDNSSESIVISDLPLGYRRIINVTQTLNTLKKIIKPEIDFI